MTIRKKVKRIRKNLVSKSADGRRSMGTLDLFGSVGYRNASHSEYLTLYRSRVFAAVNAISDGIVGLEYHLVNEKKDEIQHEYTKFVTPEILEAVASYLKICGSAYLWKVGTGTGKRVYGLQVLRPDLIITDFNETRSKILRYRYSYGGNMVTFLPEELVVIHNFNPYEPVGLQSRGMSEIQAIAVTINNENAGEIWNWKFFENHNGPGTVLTTDSVIDEEDAERIKASWEEEYKGVNNAHKLAVLGNGLKLDSMKPGQKEADFVEQQKFSFEKILAIFKVPKALLGMGDGVNVGNVRAFDLVFAKNVIKPLARKIADALNRQLLNGIGMFEFVNIVPVDETELRQDYLAGTITLNEYRALRGLKPLNEGDVLYDQTPVTIAVATTEKGPQKRDFTDIIRRSVAKYVYGSEEWAQERWQKKLNRRETYEKGYKKLVRTIFMMQENDVLKQLEDQKAAKFVMPTLNFTKFMAIWITLLKPLQKILMEKEGQLAMDEVAPGKTYDANTDQVKNTALENIKRLAKTVDDETMKQISRVIQGGIDAGLTPQQIRDKVSQHFENMTRDRADKIVRSEISRATTISTQQAREQSGVVEEKIRWTALNERVCPQCNALHGTKVRLADAFYKKGESAVGTGGQVMKLDYRDTIGPPLHPNCACDIVAVLAE